MGIPFVSVCCYSFFQPVREWSQRRSLMVHCIIEFSETEVLKFYKYNALARFEEFEELFQKSKSVISTSECKGGGLLF